MVFHGFELFGPGREGEKAGGKFKLLVNGSEEHDLGSIDLFPEEKKNEYDQFEVLLEERGVKPIQLNAGDTVDIFWNIKCYNLNEDGWQYMRYCFSSGVDEPWKDDGQEEVFKPKMSNKGNWRSVPCQGEWPTVLYSNE